MGIHCLSICDHQILFSETHGKQRSLLYYGLSCKQLNLSPSMYHVHEQLLPKRLAYKKCTAMESRLHQEAIFKHQLFHSNQSNTFKHQLFHSNQSNTCSSQLFLIVLHSYIQQKTQHRAVSSGSSYAHDSWLYCGHMSLWHSTGSESYVEDKNKNKNNEEGAASRKST